MCKKIFLARIFLFCYYKKEVKNLKVICWERRGILCRAGRGCYSVRHFSIQQITVAFALVPYRDERAAVIAQVMEKA